MGDGSSPSHRFHNADDCHTAPSHTLPLSHNQELSLTPAPQGSIVVVGAGLYGGLETPGAGDGSLLRQLPEAAAASAAARRRREGGRVI